MFIFLMSTHTVITVIFAIATYTGITKGIQEEPEQGIYVNAQPLEDHSFMQEGYFDETPILLLPFSTIVQRNQKI
jgi:hypothetical protein